MAQFIFSHANGFPASTYRYYFQALRAAGHEVFAIECIGHDPRYPVSSNWPGLVDQLAAFTAEKLRDSNQDSWLLGHSLGGYLSMMCAASHAEFLAQGLAGVIVLDAPIIGGWKAQGLRWLKQSPLVGSLLPGRHSRKRRRKWPDEAAVRAHFEHKPAFKRWHSNILDDYVRFGTCEVVDPEGQSYRTLCFNRDIETQIYNTVPDHLESFLFSRSIGCRLAYLSGKQSVEAKRIGLESTRKLLGQIGASALIEIPGSHLFPMEHPQETLEQILRIVSR
ncbi:MAG: alpha/beta hydrolase [Betaproteobacteria bacterium]|nr:alpha/beta hydrolase [Betaproteobacteria bacterium]